MVPKDWGDARARPALQQRWDFLQQPLSRLSWGSLGPGQAARPFTNTSRPPWSRSSFYQLRMQPAGSWAARPFSFVHLPPLPRHSQHASQSSRNTHKLGTTCRQARTSPASQTDFLLLSIIQALAGSPGRFAPVTGTNLN